MSLAARGGGRGTDAGLIAIVVGYQWLYNGVNYVAFKIAVDALPAFALSALRFGIAGMVLLPLAAWRLHLNGWPAMRQFASAALIGIVMLVCSQAVSMWGVHYLPAGLASVFGSSSPLFLALFAWALLRQPLTGRQLTGIGVGFAGLALMGWSSAAAGDLKLIGVAAVLIAAAAWAAGSLLAARLRLPDDPVVGLTAQLLVAGGVLTLVSVATGEAGSIDLGRVPGRAWGALAYLVVASTLLGYAAFLWLNRTMSSTLANTFFYVAPVIAMGLAALFLAEPLSWSKIAAAGIALAGVALMVTGSHSASKRRMSL